MKRFLKWLSAFILIFSIWISGIIRTNGSNDYYEWYFKGFPIIVLLAFCAYSATVILYRTFTFNNCEKAAIELQEQMKEARTDLKSKGLIFTK